MANDTPKEGGRIKRPVAKGDTSTPPTAVWKSVVEENSESHNDDAEASETKSDAEPMARNSHEGKEEVANNNAAESSKAENSSESENSQDQVPFERQVLKAIDDNNYETLQKLSRKRKMEDFINIRDLYQPDNTLLHLVVKRRKRKTMQGREENKKIMEFLVKHGAAVGLKNKEGYTPLDIYNRRFQNKEEDYEEICKILSVEAASSSSVSYSESQENVSQMSASFIANTAVDQSNSGLDRDEQIYQSNEEYNSGGLKLNLHGSIYQLQLLMLFLYQAIKCNYISVTLATEMKDADKFDDIILKFKKKSQDDHMWRLLQAKHVLAPKKKKIDIAQLFTKSSKFSLYMYFEHFCKILDNNAFKNAKFQEFTLCTNAHIDPVIIEKYLDEDKNFKIDRVMFIKSHKMRKFKLNGDGKTQIQKNFKSDSCDDKRLTQFVHKFRLITNYPDRRQVNKVINQELGERFNLLDAELATNTFLKYVLNWFMDYKDQKSKFLEGSDALQFLKIIRNKIENIMSIGVSDDYIDELSNFQVQFSESPKELNTFLVCEISQVLMVTTETPLLSSIKVNNGMQSCSNFKAKDSKIMLPLSKVVERENTRDLALNSFASETNFNLLVLSSEILNENKCNLAVMDEICLKLTNILKSNQQKKIILIAPSANIFLEKFKGHLTKIKSNEKYVNDKNENQFKYLTFDSKTSLLRQQVYFQGILMPFNKLIDVRSADSIVDNKTLIKLIEKRDIRIDEPYKTINDNNIYVQRTLTPQIIDPSILRDTTFLSSNCLIISNATEADLKNVGSDVNKKHLFDYVHLDRGIKLLNKNINYQNFLKEYAQRNNKVNLYFIEYTKGYLVFKKFMGHVSPIKKFIHNGFSEIKSNYNIWMRFHEATHYDVSENKCGIEINEKDLTKLHTSVDNKTYIISANSGYGKSLLLSNMTNTWKSKFPNLWVKRVNLNDYASSRGSGKLKLSNINDNFNKTETKKAILFLSNMLFSNNVDDENLQKKIFEFALTAHTSNALCPKVILLFDGFDEISPHYKNNTITLLNALQQTNVTEIWTTTRVHETASLEDELEVVALNLDRFSPQQKRAYFNLFQKDLNLEAHPARNKITFKQQHSITYDISDSDFYLFTSNIDFKKDIFSNRQNRLKIIIEHTFTAIPIHLDMILKVLINPNYNDRDYAALNLNHTGLYELFIEMKFDLFYKDKTSFSSDIPADNDMSQRDKKNLILTHENLAFETLFPDVVEKHKPIKLDKSSIDSLLRIGFVSKKNDDQLDFIHRSYAEYFASSHIISNFYNAEIQCLFFNTLLPDNGDIVDFVNINIKNKAVTCLNESLTLKLNPNDVYNNLQVLSDYKKYNIFDYYLSWLQKSNHVFFNNIYQQHICVDPYVDTRNYSEILDSKERDLVLDIIKCLIKNKVSYGGSGGCVNLCSTFLNELNIFMHIIFTYWENSSIHELLDYIYSNGLNPDLKLFLNFIKHVCLICNKSILHIACFRGRFDHFEQITKWALNKYQEKSITRTSKEPLILKYGSGESFNHVPNLVVLQHFHESVLHPFQFIADLFGAETLKKLMNMKDNDRTLFLYNFHVYRNDLLKDMLNFLSKAFNQEFVKELITMSGEMGRTVLHCSVWGDAKIDLISLFQFIVDKFGKDTLKKLIVMRENNGMLFLHYPRVYGDDLPKDLLNFFSKLFDQQFVKGLITRSSKEGRTILHYSMWYGVKIDLISLFQFIVDTFGTDTLKELIIIKDNDGKLFLHYEHVYDDDLLIDLLNFISKVFDQQFVKNLMTISGQIGRTILHYSVMSDVKIDLILLFQFIVDTFGTDTLKELIIMNDNDGKLFLNYDRVYDDDLLKDLLNFISKELDQQFVKELMTMSDKKGSTILHYSMEYGAKIDLISLFQFIVDTFGTDTLKELIILKKNDGTLFLQNFRVYRDDLLIDLLNFISKVFGQQFAKGLITISNEEGRTILHCSVRYDVKHESISLFQFIVDRFGTDTLKDLIIMKDIHGKLFLHYDRVYDDDLLIDLLNFISKVFGQQFVEELITMPGEEGRTILHYSMGYDVKIDLISLFQFIVDTFGADTLKELIIMKDINRKLFLHYRRACSDDLRKDLLNFISKVFGQQFVKKLMMSVEKGTRILAALYEVTEQTLPEGHDILFNEVDILY